MTILTNKFATDMAMYLNISNIIAKLNHIKIFNLSKRIFINNDTV